ncbi:hypothetical protein FH972_022281 [Carpinus fangiana]|uniref:Uncharacterized protein n=1 Tax=Carpinus fangiana TaxID=176857 RepID=A0A5N6KS54_9ROSI|nr:hypothetical protein FH972_022281 [Carpinus fangiana]
MRCGLSNVPRTILVRDPACAPAMGSMALVENPGLHPTQQAVSERLASPDGAVLTGPFPVACGGEFSARVNAIFHSAQYCNPGALPNRTGVVGAGSSISFTQHRGPDHRLCVGDFVELLE